MHENEGKGDFETRTTADKQEKLQVFSLGEMSLHELRFEQF